MIRGVKRYNESAKIECDILIDIQNKGGAQSGIVYLKEYFHFQDKEGDHMCLVFEPLGKSLYDFIKENKYKGPNTIIDYVYLRLLTFPHPIHDPPIPQSSGIPPQPWHHSY